MQTKQLTPGLLVLFLVVIIGWYVGSPSAIEKPGATTRAVALQTGLAPGARSDAEGQPRAIRSSPFLATHDQGEAFTPTADNLAPSFHVEMEALKRRLDAAPQDTTALLRLARLKQDGHQTEEAVTYYRQYLALHPEGRQAWLDLMQCLGDLEQWAGALEAVHTLLRYYPDDAGGLYNLGAIYANTNRFEDARTAWEQVAEQDRHVELKMMAGSALQRLKAIHP